MSTVKAVVGAGGVKGVQTHRRTGHPWGGGMTPGPNLSFCRFGMARWILSAALRRTRVLFADRDVSSCTNNTKSCVSIAFSPNITWFQQTKDAQAYGVGKQHEEKRNRPSSHTGRSRHCQ